RERPSWFAWSGRRTPSRSQSRWPRGGIFSERGRGTAADSAPRGSASGRLSAGPASPGRPLEKGRSVLDVAKQAVRAAKAAGADYADARVVAEDSESITVRNQVMEGIDRAASEG